MAFIRSVRLLDIASTSNMFASGAIACTHSTSKEVSTAHPLFVVVPAIFSIVKLGAGRPYSLSKVARLLAMFGSL